MANIEGLTELQNKLRKLKGIGDNPKALLAGAFVLQKYSQENAPVGETGFLKNSISSRENTNGAEVFVGADYGYYVEMGTSKMAAKPYIRPAIEQHSNEIVNAVAKVLDGDISEVGGG